MVTITIDPILARFGSVTLTWHGLLLACGIGVVYVRAVMIGGKQNISRTVISEFAIWCFVAGLIMARLVWILGNLWFFQARLLAVFDLRQGGITINGALLGFLLAAFAFTRLHNHSFTHFSEIVTRALPPGYLLGRVGCLIQGDIWGLPTGQFWGLAYQNPATDIPDKLLGVATFPVLPVMMVFMLGLWGVLEILQRRLHPAGLISVVFLILYGLERFILGFWQAGDGTGVGVKPFQISGLILLVMGLAWGTGILNRRFIGRRIAT